METIISYVNSMFQPYPSTKELLDAKENIISNMVEKYEELKKEGKSEHEAIGLVISEFGNIEELLQELGIHTTPTDDSGVAVSFEQAKEYVAVKERSGFLITIGVGFCMLGLWIAQIFDALTHAHILTSFLDSSGDSIFGIAGFLGCVAIGVVAFLYAGSLLKPFSTLEHGVILDLSTASYLKEQKERESRINTIFIAIGVVLCILSPAGFSAGEAFLGSSNEVIEVATFFFIIIAVLLFVSAGCNSSKYDLLLKTPTVAKKEQRTNTLYGTINGCIMMAATAIYLVAGFCFHNWNTSAIVFIVGGILCGITSTIVWALSAK